MTPIKLKLTNDQVHLLNSGSRIMSGNQETFFMPFAFRRIVTPDPESELTFDCINIHDLPVREKVQLGAAGKFSAEQAIDLLREAAFMRDQLTGHDDLWRRVDEFLKKLK
jgi:hypothetical protein